MSPGAQRRTKGGEGIRVTAWGATNNEIFRSGTFQGVGNSFCTSVVEDVGAMAAVAVCRAYDVRVRG